MYPHAYVITVLYIFTLWKLITLTLIAIDDYRPALQAVFSVVYVSHHGQSVLFSVWQEDLPAPSHWRLYL